MNAREIIPTTPGLGRTERVREVVERLIDRRIAGDGVSDREILDAHPDLLPELADELAKVSMIERARRRASSGRTGLAGPVPSLPGNWLPGYEIQSEIHRGGQGVVYRAVKASTGRVVAIKVTRAGRLADVRDLARLDREVRILAGLRHPHIVAVYDSGLSPDGSAYLVMDHIDGLTLDRHVERLTTGGISGVERVEAVLRLMSRICDAVSAAHLRGVIHRDIKPGNVMVDGSGAPHVLDFGLARFEHGDASDMTQTGQFVGSLPWASPEQTQGDASRVDIRSDVYSLGLVLYHCLLGRMPYDTRGSVTDTIERIRTASPARPRGIDPAIDPDLETIVLRALAKEPERRYQSAGELARDIERLRSGEPIDARRDSSLYVLRKTLGRFRVALFWGLAALTLLAVTAGWAGLEARRSARLATDERAARVAAEDARAEAITAQIEASRQFDEATRARAAEILNRESAERESRHAKAVTDFLIGTLGMANPDVSQATDLTMKEALQRAAEQIDGAFEQQPGAELQVRIVVGRAYAALGELNDARRHLERAWALMRETDGDADPFESYELSRVHLRVLEDLGDDGWRDAWWAFLRLTRSMIDHRTPELMHLTFRISNNVNERFDAAELDEAYELLLDGLYSRVSPDDPHWLVVADYLSTCGDNHGFRERPAVASRFLREALKIRRHFLPETNSEVARSLGELTRRLIEAGRASEAEGELRSAMHLIEDALPAGHWYPALLSGRLAACRIAQGDLAEARLLLEQGESRVRAALGPGSRARIELLGYTARLAEREGESEQALTLRREAASLMVAAERRVFRSEYLTWILSDGERERLAGARLLEESPLVSTARFHEALCDVLDARRALFADDDPRAAALADFLVMDAVTLRRRRGVNDDTLRMLEEARAILTRSADVHTWKLGAMHHWLAYNLRPIGRLEEAESEARRALELWESADMGPRTAFVSSVRALLGQCRADLGRSLQARQDLEQAYREAVSNYGRSENALFALYYLTDFFARQKTPEMSLPFLRDYGRISRIPWRASRPLISAQHPELAAKLDELNRLRQRPEVARTAVAEFVELRRKTLPNGDPMAALVADAAFGILDAAMTVEAHPAWEPLSLDCLEIETTQHGDSRIMLNSRLFWQAMLLTEKGDFVAADEIARRCDEHHARFRPNTPGAGASRRLLVARAMIGQGRYAEAREILDTVASPLLSVNERRKTRHTISAIVDLQRAGEANPSTVDMLKSFCLLAVEFSREAEQLATFSIAITNREGLPPELYESALKLTEAAVARNPEGRGVQVSLAAALVRTNQPEEALRVSPGMNTTHAESDPRARAFRVIAQAATGRVAEASAGAAELSEWAASQGPLSLAVRRLIDEARDAADAAEKQR